MDKAAPIDVADMAFATRANKTDGYHGIIFLIGRVAEPPVIDLVPVGQPAPAVCVGGLLRFLDDIPVREDIASDGGLNLSFRKTQVLGGGRAAQFHAGPIEKPADFSRQPWLFNNAGFVLFVVPLVES